MPDDSNIVSSDQRTGTSEQKTPAEPEGMPRQNQQTGLRNTVLATSNDKHEERMTALRNKFPNVTFNLKDHETRKQITVSSGEDLTPALLEQMRRVARSIT